MKLTHAFLEGVTSDRIEYLERDNKALQRDNKILKVAGTFSALAELDRRLKY